MQPAALRASLLLKLLFLSVAVLLLFSLETGRALLTRDDTSHIPVAAAFFATSQASLDALAADAQALHVSAAALALPAAASGAQDAGAVTADSAAAPAVPAAPAVAPAVPAAPAAPAAPAVILLSTGRPVQASARGNLGEPSVVTSEAVDDWLAHRWQAAANMQGDPLPGEHWLEIDLGAPCALRSFLVDFEKAHAVKYTIQSRGEQEGGGWVDVAAGSAARETSRSDMHIIHELPASADAVGRWVRLLIHEPATHWGTSVWRFHVYGTPHAA